MVGLATAAPCSTRSQIRRRQRAPGGGVRRTNWALWHKCTQLQNAALADVGRAAPKNATRLWLSTAFCRNPTGSRTIVQCPAWQGIAGLPGTSAWPCGNCYFFGCAHCPRLIGNAVIVFMISRNAGSTPAQLEQMVDSIPNNDNVGSVKLPRK